MTSSTAARAKTLGFRSLLVLGGTTLAVTALALPSHAAPVTPSFHSAQSRLLDTRTSPSVTGPVHGLVVVPVTAAVPSGDTVELTVTSTGSTGSGYVVAYPDGSSLPGTSDLNYSVGRTISSTLVTQVPADGEVDVYVAGASTQVIVDQQGYFDSSALSSTAPVRVADSRIANAGFSPAGAQSGMTSFTLPTGDFTAGKPVALNVTALPTATGAGYVTAYTPAATAPSTSTVSYGSDLPASNLVFVTPSAAGVVDLKVAGISAYILVDLEATAPTGSSVVSNGSRIADSRVPTGLPAGPLKGAHTLTVPVADAPSGTTGVILNITSTSQTGNGYITAYQGSTVPMTSELQFTKGQTVAQTVIVPVTATGSSAPVTLNISGSSSQVIVDTEGYVGVDNPA